MSKTSTKELNLQHWAQLPANQPILKHMKVIHYKARGSKYGTCGIRIDGTPEFVDAVLSHLQELIAGENSMTRLELSRSQVGPVTIGDQTKGFENAETGAEVCYIRLHERGPEAQMLNAFIDGCKAKHDARELELMHA